MTRWDFGLEPAWAAVEITYQDGEKAELLIGDLTPNQETPQRYCVKTGDPRLFTLLTADSAAFGYRLEALRAFDQPSLNASLLDGVIISGDKEMTLRYTPSGWLMDAPWAYPVSLTRMDSLLEKIAGMRFEACLGKTGDVDLKRCGLDRFFDAVFTCSEVGAGKDSPDIFRAAMAHHSPLSSTSSTR